LARPGASCLRTQPRLSVRSGPLPRGRDPKLWVQTPAYAACELRVLDYETPLPPLQKRLMQHAPPHIHTHTPTHVRARKQASFTKSAQDWPGARALQSHFPKWLKPLHEPLHDIT
jgi:hypothetical protein